MRQRSILTAIFLPAIVIGVTVGLASAQNPVSVTMTASPSSVPAGGKGTVRIAASIDGGWHMYSITQGAGGPIPTRISFGEGPVKVGPVRGPRPKVQADPNFGIDTETYSGSAVFTAPFTVDPSAPEGPQAVSATIRYQVCNDTVCLPPRSVKLAADISIGAGRMSPTPTPAPSPSPTVSPNTANGNTESNADTANTTAVQTPDANTASVAAGPGIGQQGDGATVRPAESVSKDQPIWRFIWLAMTFGALSLLTPCVFPMIPITVSYFTKHGSTSTAGSIRDAFIYAVGIILTFTALGVALAVIFGAAGITRFAANPYVNLLITGIFLAFAFSLIGAFSFGVPSGVLTKLDNFTRSNRSGKTIGLLLMGLTFSLTSFTCTAPLVGTILVAAANGDLLYPVIGMLAFSAVFAAPFFILAVMPQFLQSLPRSGSWMNSVKVIMGFLEIAAALKFLSNADLIWGWGIFTREVVIAGWLGVCVLSFLYLIGVFRFPHDPETKSIGLARAMNALIFAGLFFYLLTGLFGARLGELESFLPPMRENAVSSSGERPNGELTWITNDLDAALKQAQTGNKNILIDFTGYTCTNCRWMEANMFPRPAVKAELEKFVRVRLYTDGEGEPYEGFQRMQEERFGTVALPMYVVLTPQNELVAKFEGLTRDENEFASFLRR